MDNIGLDILEQNWRKATVKYLKKKSYFYKMMIMDKIRSQPFFGEYEKKEDSVKVKFRSFSNT